MTFFDQIPKGYKVVGMEPTTEKYPTPRMRLLYMLLGSYVLEEQYWAALAQWLRQHPLTTEEANMEAPRNNVFRASFFTYIVYRAEYRLKFRSSDISYMTEILSHLLHAGANPNGFPYEKLTPLQRVISLSSPDEEFQYSLVKLLLESGADPNLLSPNKEKQDILAVSPLQATLRSDHYSELGVLLLQAGADPNYEWVSMQNANQVYTWVSYVVPQMVRFFFSKESRLRLLKAAVDANANFTVPIAGEWKSTKTERTAAELLRSHLPDFANELDKYKSGWDAEEL